MTVLVNEGFASAILEDVATADPRRGLAFGDVLVGLAQRGSDDMELPFRVAEVLDKLVKSNALRSEPGSPTRFVLTQTGAEAIQNFKLLLNGLRGQGEEAREEFGRQLLKEALSD